MGFSRWEASGRFAGWRDKHSGYFFSSSLRIPFAGLSHSFGGGEGRCPQLIEAPSPVLVCLKPTSIFVNSARVRLCPAVPSERLRFRLGACLETPSPWSCLRAPGVAFSIPAGVLLGTARSEQDWVVAAEIGTPVPPFCVPSWSEPCQPISSPASLEPGVTQPVPVEQLGEGARKCRLGTSPSVAVLPASVFGPWACSAHGMPAWPRPAGRLAALTHTLSPPARACGAGWLCSTWPF